MTAWLLIRTALRKELVVCRAIERMGFPAWCPMEKRMERVNRHSKVRAPKDYPILSKWAFAAVPVALQADLLKIRYLDTLERDAALGPIQIPASELQLFRAEVDRINELVLALALPPKRAKEKWLPLKEGMQLKLEQARLTRMEEAA